MTVNKALDQKYRQIWLFLAWNRLLTTTSVAKQAYIPVFFRLSRAFDTLNHNLLWQKLLQTSFPHEVVGLLIYWYRNQTNSVRYNRTSRRATNCRAEKDREGWPLRIYLIRMYSILSWSWAAPWWGLNWMSDTSTILAMQMIWCFSAPR